MRSTQIGEELSKTINPFFAFDVKIIHELTLSDVIENQNLVTNIEKTLSKLREAGWKTYIVPHPRDKTANCYWSDFDDTYLENKYGDKWSEEKYICLRIYLDEEGEKINPNREIEIYYTKMSSDDKKTVLTIFHDELQNNYEWSGNNLDNMFIYYEPLIISEQIDFDKLKSDDIYPHVHIYVNINPLSELDSKVLELVIKFKEIFSNYKTTCDIELDIGDLSYIEFDAYCVNDEFLKQLHTELYAYLKPLEELHEILVYNVDVYINDNEDVMFFSDDSYDYGDASYDDVDSDDSSNIQIEGECKNNYFI